LTDLPRVSVLGGLLKRIGNYDPTSFREKFEARLILQKTIYLMQAFGLNIGYSYSWYLRGPYSVDLTRDAYELTNKFDRAPLARFVADEDEKKFHGFLVSLGDKRNDDRWLEITASIHFLGVALPTRTKEGIHSEVARKIHGLSRKEFDKSWEWLAEHGLLRHKRGKRNE